MPHSQMLTGVMQVFVDSHPPLSLAPKLYTEMWRTFEDLHHSVDATISFVQVSRALAPSRRELITFRRSRT